MTDQISEICKAFERMHNEFLEMKINLESEVDVTRAYKELSIKYNDILNAFPMMFKWIVFIGDYYPKAIRETVTLYLTKIKNVLTTDSDFTDKLIDIYADYPTAVYKIKNPKIRDNTKIYAYKESVKKSFKADFDAIEKENKAKEEEKRVQLENEIYDILN